MKYNKNDLQFKKKYFKYKKKYLLLKKRRQLLKQKGGMFGVAAAATGAVSSAPATAIAAGAGYFTYRQIRSGVNYVSECVSSGVQQATTTIMNQFYNTYFVTSYKLLEDILGVTRIKERKRKEQSQRFFTKYEYPPSNFLTFNTYPEAILKEEIKGTLGMFINDGMFKQEAGMEEADKKQVEEQNIFLLNDFFISHLHLIFLIRRKIDCDTFIVKKLLDKLIHNSDHIKIERIYNNLYTSLKIYLFKKNISRKLLGDQCPKVNFLNLTLEDWDKKEFKHLVPPIVFSYYKKFKDIDWFNYYYKTIIVLILRIINLDNNYNTHLKIIQYFDKKYTDFTPKYEDSFQNKIRTEIKAQLGNMGIDLLYRTHYEEELLKRGIISTESNIFPILKTGDDVWILYKKKEGDVVVKKEDCEIGYNETVRSLGRSLGGLFSSSESQDSLNNITINLNKEFEIKDRDFNKKILEIGPSRREGQIDAGVVENIEEAIEEFHDAPDELAAGPPADQLVLATNQPTQEQLSVVNRYNQLINSTETRLQNIVLGINNPIDFNATYSDKSTPTKEPKFQLIKDKDQKCVIMPAQISSPYYIRIHQGVLNGNYSIEDQMDGCHKAIEEVALSLLPFIEEQINPTAFRQLTLNN